MNLRGLPLRAPHRFRSRKLAVLLAAGALIAAPLASAMPALAAETPTVSVAPDTDLNPEGANTLTIAGSSFKPGSPGVYVAVGPKSALDVAGWHADADLFTAFEWVNSIPENGKFSTEITLDSPVFSSGEGEIDCTAAECGVFTMAAHGSPDRSQDTYTPIAFAASSDDSNEPENPEDGDGGDEGAGEGGDSDDAGENGENENDPGEDEGSDDADDGADDPITWEPELQLFDADGKTLGTSEVAEGDVLTVSGAGFDPEANISTRPPIPVGSPSGYYVVFGKFAPDWKPSEGAPGTNRTTGDQRWALSEAVLDAIDPRFESAVRAEWVPLSDAGTFDAELTVGELEDGPENGVYGVYVYAAGGAANPDYELAAPVNFTPTDSDERPGDGEEDEDNDDDGAENGDGNDGTQIPQPDKCLAAEDGVLAWGIYDSFRNYMGQPFVQGSITTNGVTEANGIYGFKFASGTFNSENKSGVIKYTGSVHFSGHGGELDVKFSNPQLHIKGTSGSLVLDVTTDGKTKKEQVFATVDLTSANQSVSGFSVKNAKTALTAAGSGAMQGFYDEGTVVDALTASFSLSGSAECGEPVVTAPKPESDAKPKTESKPPIAGSGAGVDATATGNSAVAGPMCRATKSASLTWGVKKSFADYVTGPIAAGAIGTANGVTGSFNWPGRASTYDPDSGTGQLSFGGTVNFTGHDGALNMRISNPRVQILDGTTARLFADVRSTNPAGKVTVDAGGVHIANLNIAGKRAVSGDAVTFNAVPATLTSAGVPAFAEFYEAGSALDALSISITLGPEVPCADVASGTDSLPRTGGGLELAGAGIVLVLLGASAAAVRRRVNPAA